MRSAHLLSYLDILQDVGSSAPEILSQYNLPPVDRQRRDEYIPLIHCLRFLTATSPMEDTNDFAYRGASATQLRDLDPRFSTIVLKQPTLMRSLQVYAELASLEFNSLRVAVKECGASLRVCSRLTETDFAEGQAFLDWILNLMGVNLIRGVLGPAWQPPAMGLVAGIPCKTTRDAWPETDFSRANSACWFEVPVSDMARSTSDGSEVAMLENKRAADVYGIALPPYDVVGALRLVLRCYLAAGQLRVATAAELVGVSVRTLQRKLSEGGVSYSQLVDDVRLARAKEILRDDRVRVQEVARAVGYEDPAHFTRAFCRIAGMSPTQYRSDKQNTTDR